MENVILNAKYLQTFILFEWCVIRWPNMSLVVVLDADIRTGVLRHPLCADRRFIDMPIQIRFRFVILPIYTIFLNIKSQCGGDTGVTHPKTWRKSCIWLLTGCIFIISICFLFDVFYCLRFHRRPTWTWKIIMKEIF